MPGAPKLLPFVLAVAFLVGVVQFGIVRIAFDKLGLSAESAYLLLACTLGGSLLNLPLFRIRAPAAASSGQAGTQPPASSTTVAINVGGAVVPVAFSFYLIARYPLGLFQVAAGVALVAVICHRASRPIPQVGIGMPMLVAPVAAALVALLLGPEQRAPLAYICGTLGVLIGADLARLRDIRALGAPRASIGGAGTFDGVFLSGFVAVLLT